MRILVPVNPRKLEEDRAVYDEWRKGSKPTGVGNEPPHVRSMLAGYGDSLICAANRHHDDGYGDTSILDIAIPQQYTTYARTCEIVRSEIEADAARILDRLKSGAIDFDHANEAIGDLETAAADTAVPVYDYHRIMMIAEEPEIMDTETYEAVREVWDSEDTPSELLERLIWQHFRDFACEAVHAWQDANAWPEEGECE